MSLWMGPFTRVRQQRQHAEPPVSSIQPTQPCGCRSAYVQSSGCTNFDDHHRLAADQGHPKLWVGFICPGRWAWTLSDPDANRLDGGNADTWGEAMAIGLAALEVASIPPVA